MAADWKAYEEAREFLLNRIPEKNHDPISQKTRESLEILLTHLDDIYHEGKDYKELTHAYRDVFDDLYQNVPEAAKYVDSVIKKGNLYKVTRDD